MPTESRSVNAANAVVQADLTRAAKVIGDRGSSEVPCDDAVVEAMNRGLSVREALSIAAKACPDEAIAIDDSTYGDVSLHYEYPRQHSQTLAALRAADALPETGGAHELLGVLVYRSRGAAVCADGGACLIAGSEQQMQHYLTELDPSTAALHTIRKTRFGEALQGLCRGAAYSFDQESYSRFYPLAVSAGLPVSEGYFATGLGRRYLTVRLLQPSASETPMEAGAVGEDPREGPGPDSGLQRLRSARG